LVELIVGEVVGEVEIVVGEVEIVEEVIEVEIIWMKYL
jgi:hypothetical protein